MTCISYRAGVMAADGRVTEENTIFTNKHQKIFRLKDGGLVGSAGDADDSELVTLLNKLKGKIPTHKQLQTLEFEFAAILVLSDGRVYILESSREDKENKAYKTAVFEMKEQFVSIGSGSAWAMGAMDRGATAEQSVKTAIKFDNNCGGTVQSTKLKEQQ